MEEHIILIPGTESSASQAFRGLSPLLGRDFSVHEVDFSSALHVSADEQLANYVDQVFDSVSTIPPGDTVHVLGYSLGAHIALRFASTHPRRVSSLTLVSGWLAPSPYQSKRHDLWVELFAASPPLAGKLSHILQYSPSYLKLLGSLQTPMVLEPSVPGEEIRRRVLVNREVNAVDAAKAVDCPTLIIHGSEDLKVPADAAYELSGQIRDARLAFVTGGHALLSEKLGEVYGHLHDFLMNGLPVNSVIEPKVV